VALVGGGPGDEGLLTVRGRRLLAGADVVVRDRLAPHVRVPDGVEVVEVGKTPGGASWAQRDIEHLLVERARGGARVVRLKGATCTSSPAASRRSPPAWRPAWPSRWSPASARPSPSRPAPASR
jgi:hypothetical protein